MIPELIFIALATVLSTQPPAVCPTLCNLATVPSVNFGPSGGTAYSGSSVGCCPQQFQNCPPDQKLCRQLMRYRITQGPSQNVEQCPSTSPDCTCQQSFFVDAQLNLKLCPNKPTCCATCDCWGDPHCRAFNRSQSNTLSICDARAENCVSQKSICRTLSYGGMPCQWTGKLCVRNPATPVPQFDMYTKEYTFLSQPQTFRLNLELGIYGAIIAVQITDGDVNLRYQFYPNGACDDTQAPGYPFENNIVKISGLPSGVLIVLTCFPFSVIPRMDLVISDPTYSVGLQTQDGFCVTDQFEGVVGNPVRCTGVNTNIAEFFGCKKVKTCQQEWCQNNWQKLSIGGFSSLEACQSFIIGTPFNWISALCSLTPKVLMGASQIDPTLCEQNAECLKCKLLSLDNPSDIGTQLTPNPRCESSFLLQTGLARGAAGGIPVPLSGIQIEFQNPDNSWTAVFALLNEEIEPCGCPNIFASNTDSNNAPLFRPGQYRVRQCTAIDTQNSFDICDGMPAYKVNMTVAIPGDGATSLPLGPMWDDGAIICSPEAYPNCPENYRCCPWPEFPVWKECMKKNHPGASKKCVFEG